MRKFPFFWVDAFTEQKLGGNPCAVILNADALTEAQMQGLAREMNLSETAFVMSSARADFRARYFTPEEELPFAGHPTVAVTHVLEQEGLVKGSKVSLELPAGVIPVEVQREGQRPPKILMSQLAPRFLRTYSPQEILSIYGLSPDDLLPGAPIQTVSTGSAFLMIPMASHEVLGRVEYVDIDRFQRLRASGDFRFPHHFCIQGATPKGATFARSLGRPPSTAEDPFTGSATGCMAAYLWKHGLISSPAFVAEQGHWMGRPGEAEVEVVGPRHAIEGVRVGGRAVSLISGMIEV